MRIAWFVHGRGKGHSVRALAAVPSFASHEVHLFGGGEATKTLHVLPRFTAIEACLPGPGVLRQFPRRLRADVARLRTLAPDVLISDGDGPSVHAARLLGIPSIAMSHGLIFGHTQLPSGLPRWAILRERINAASASWCADHRIAVHFAPLEARTRGTIVARPDPRPGLERRASDGSIVAYFRDGGGEAWLEGLAKEGHRIVCFGHVSRPIAGVEARPASVDGFARALETAAGVVATAGNHLPAECAALGIPMLALHAESDMEQSMNARLVEHAGLGIGGCLERPDASRISAYAALLGANPQSSVSRSMTLPTVTGALQACLAAYACSSPR